MQDTQQAGDCEADWVRLLFRSLLGSSFGWKQAKMSKSGSVTAQSFQLFVTFTEGIQPFSRLPVSIAHPSRRVRFWDSLRATPRVSLLRDYHIFFPLPSSVSGEGKRRSPKELPQASA
jgi:hypothetical protein